jgi:hypothetical protein
MIFGWKSLDSHREFPTNKSVGVLINKCMLFLGGVPFVPGPRLPVNNLRIKAETHRLLPDFFERSDLK